MSSAVTSFHAGPSLIEMPESEWDEHLRGLGSFDHFGYPFWWGTPPSETLDPVILAVLRYRQTHGALPETLDGLVPVFLAEVPVDGTTGEPLILVQSTTSFSVCGTVQKGPTQSPCAEFRFNR